MLALFNTLNVHLQKNRNMTLYLFFIISTSLFIHLLCMFKTRLLVEEAYYWNYAQHLDFSYLDHPPMVALLIKLFTSLLGTDEFSVRCASLVCWVISALFNYKLSELMQPNTGRYSVLLLAVLPFFFFQSIIMTPDVPLIACWSASLYYLYRALSLNEGHNWYKAGLWLGLGMLSKYTICLLGLASIAYVLSESKARFWLKRKEPYLAALITTLLFTPVLYWNATHEWASFVFQSSRRFSTTTSIDTHNLIWMTLFFITPLGAVGLYELLKKNPQNMPDDNKKFCRYFTLIPLAFFSLYSINHEVNFNWIGPLFLALIPWLAQLISKAPHKKTLWLINALFLLLCYSTILLVVNFNQSELIQTKLLPKVIAWDDLIKQLHQIATEEEQKTHQSIVFVPLDNYPLNSELSFYQTKFLAEGRIAKMYPTLGAHIFNQESLMYRYWNKPEDLSDKLLILVAKERWRFSLPEINNQVHARSELSKIWSIGQGQQLRNIPYYYKVVQMK